MTVKTTSQGVLHSQIWSLSGGLWPGDGSSKKVRGELNVFSLSVPQKKVRLSPSECI